MSISIACYSFEAIVLVVPEQLSFLCLTARAYSLLPFHDGCDFLLFH